MHLRPGFTELAEAFEAAGIHLVQDPRDLQIPGGIASPDRSERLTLGTISTTWNVYLIPADNGHTLDGLDDLLDKLAAAALLPTSAEFLTLSLPNIAPDPLPAVRLPFKTEN